MPPVLPWQGKSKRIQRRDSAVHENRKPQGATENTATSPSHSSFPSPTLYSIVGPRSSGNAAAVRRCDVPSRRCRSRHLLLALFFPATRHLHNYNLASAVSKTPAHGRGPRLPDFFSASVSGPVVVRREEKKKKERRRMESGGDGEGRGKNELLPLTRRAMTVSY